MAKNILVVGDWLVDEHWLTGIHRSSFSSRVGDAHYRALHDSDSVVTTFCGAGTPASLLYQLKDNDGKHRFNIIGLGLWHEDDTDILKSMFELNHKTLSPYKLAHNALGTNVENVELHNLSAALPPGIKEKISTTRIIRIYHSWSSTSNKIRYYRVDWEKDLSNTSLEYEDDALKKILTEMKTKAIDAIVIKDMYKGVISRKLIEALSDDTELCDVPWFVSSKVWQPEWLEELKKVNLKLLLIPQIAAQEAIKEAARESKKEDALNCWITHNGQPDSSVYSTIKSLYRQVENKKNKNNILFIVLPEGYSLIACNYRDQKDNLTEEHLQNIDHYTVCTDDNLAKNSDVVLQSIVNPSSSMPLTGMASILLPIVITKMINIDKIQDVKGDELRGLIEDSLLHTFGWSQDETTKIIEGKQIGLFMDENSKLKNKNALNFNFQELMFRDERKKWAIASINIGAIGFKEGNSNTTSYAIELWRATIEVGDYVCFDESKRKELRRLIDALKEFKRGERKHHAGCMLVAEPGSGKTFLARKLAKNIGLRFLQFNITQMLKTEDILNCFDEIETAQSQDREQPILVFVDEINAKMANAAVYGAFLAPLEDGVYIRNGKEFHIAPCFWLFSGTRHLISSDSKVSSDSKDSAEDSTGKKSDFISRLSIGEIDLSIRSSRSFRVENVYLGVSLIRQEFPDVRYVSKGVLKIFYYLPEGMGIRDMKHFVKLFSDIQYNKVIIKNVPDENKIPVQLKTLMLDKDGKVKKLLESRKKPLESREETKEIKENDVMVEIRDL